MRTGLFLVILTVVVAFPVMTQERQGTGREKEPSATTSTRGKPVTKQDVSDAPVSKPREAEKRQPSSKPARVDSDTRTAPKKNPAEPVPSENVDAWRENGNPRGPTYAEPIGGDHQRVFDNVRNGLNSGNISSFAELLGPQVQVNLRGGESGYYSSSQAYYVLENYLRSNRFSGLEYGTIEQAGDAPFASGKADLDQKGMKGAAQVYVSLSQVGGKWVISQIKIY